MLCLPGIAFQLVIAVPLVQQRSYSFLNVVLGMVSGVGDYLLKQLIFLLCYAVPVVVLFTKTDFFDDEVIEYLLEHHIYHTVEEAREKASQQDWLGFEKQLSEQIRGMKYKPKGHIFLRGKHWHCDSLSTEWLTNSIQICNCLGLIVKIWCLGQQLYFQMKHWNSCLYQHNTTILKFVLNMQSKGNVSQF